MIFLVHRLPRLSFRVFRPEFALAQVLLLLVQGDPFELLAIRHAFPLIFEVLDPLLLVRICIDDLLPFSLDISSSFFSISSRYLLKARLKIFILSAFSSLLSLDSLWTALVLPLA